MFINQLFEVFQLYILCFHLKGIYYFYVKSTIVLDNLIRLFLIFLPFQLWLFLMMGKTKYSIKKLTSALSHDSQHVNFEVILISV